MRSYSIGFWGLLCLVGAVGLPTRLWAGDPSPTTGTSAMVTVTVRATEAGTRPAVSREDVMVYEDSQRRPVLSWAPAGTQDQRLDLAILVDDSLDANVGVQFQDLANFLRALPAGTRVRVAYAANGASNLVQDFTTDHELAVKALRLPVGVAAAGGSIYQSVWDLLKKWPDDGSRRAVLVISDGVDIYRGIVESEPGDNMDLQSAIDLAQRTNVPIYSIYARGADRLDQNAFLLNNGQGCLLRLAYETGGQTFYLGTQTPLAFAPFLNQLATDLGEQYVLTFRSLPGTKAGYQPLRVTTELPGVKLVAPARVFIPNAG
jgi:VWFA-related protein